MTTRLCPETKARRVSEGATDRLATVARRVSEGTTVSKHRHLPRLRVGLPSRRPRFQTSPLALLLLAAVSLTGCSKPPQIPADSRPLIGSLRTAVSAKRKDWLETNAKLVEQKHSQNKLTDEQYQELETIISLGREGKWADAEQETLRLAEAQQP
jgi:hypothetical protein